MRLQKSVVKPIVLMALVLALSGCLNGGNDYAVQRGFLGITPTGGGLALKRARTYALMSGSISFRAPSGYCLESSEQNKDRFALLAACDVLEADAEDSAKDRGLITIAVGAAQPQSPELRDLAQSMSRFGDVTTKQGVVFAHHKGGGSAMVPGSNERYWRAATVVGTHVVTIAAYAPPSGSLIGSKGRDLLFDLAQSMSFNGGPRPTGSVVSDLEPSEGTDPVSEQPKSLLARLFSVNGNTQQ